MSYLVLARKYRPQTFADIVGQEQVTTTLSSALIKGRIHHAFLFCGGRGTGKTTTARILAKALCCKNAPTHTPCNTCTACVEITQGTSVDVQEIDAASQNKVEDIRELRESIRYAPLQGKKKVYILDEVHMLSNSAWNALLKTLEEPPPHAVFIFATTDPHKLPATILSRVQRYDFKWVKTTIISKYLENILTQEKILFDPRSLFLIAQESGGSLRDALSLLDQVLASNEERCTEELVSYILGVAHRTLLHQLGEALAQKDTTQMLSLIKSADEKGYDLMNLAKHFVAYLRDLLIVHTTNKPSELLDLHEEEIEHLKKLSVQMGNTLSFYFHKMIHTVEDMGKSSLPRLILEIGLVDLCQTEPIFPVQQFLDKINELEQNVIHLSYKSSLSDHKIESTRMGVVTDVNKTIPTVEKHSHFEKQITRDQSNEVIQDSKEPTLSFEELVQALIKKNPLLHPISLSSPLVWDGKLLILGVKSTFLLDQLRLKNAMLKQALFDIMSTDIQIEIKVVEGELPHEQQSIVEKAEKELQLSNEKKYNEALAHPSRNMLSQVFGEGITFENPVLE